jgi:hypothetical protein
MTDNGKPTVRFTGVNVQVVSGSGTTNGAVNGTGNLIVGYNENSADTKTGSHNLIVGPRHTYTSFGGLVAGYDNSITGVSASVSGGYNNTASAYASSVSGGVGNTASGSYSSVSGGLSNTASGLSSVSGGYNNTASAYASSVSGGAGNAASGSYSSVSGGQARSAPNAHDWVAGSYFSDF